MTTDIKGRRTNRYDEEGGSQKGGDAGQMLKMETQTFGTHEAFVSRIGFDVCYRALAEGKKRFGKRGFTLCNILPSHGR